MNNYGLYSVSLIDIWLYFRDIQWYIRVDVLGCQPKILGINPSQLCTWFEQTTLSFKREINMISILIIDGL